MKGAVRMRNYSDKTLEADRYWIRKFQAFVRSKLPDHLNTEDVKGFLTDLAVRQNVAGATQNQAFNALLFFYRHVLRREFGKIDGVVRAKRRPYVPVVLSRAEVEAVLERLPAPYRLFGALLYGCCETAGKSGKQIERCVIASFQIAESMGFKGEFRQWEEMLRIGD